MFRDIVRKTRDDARLSEVFAEPLSLAFRVRHQRQNQRGRKVYSLHAPEVECIGKGKAHRSVPIRRQGPAATTLAHSKGGHGDVANAMLAAAGYNFRRLLAWFAALWLVFIMALLVAASDADPALLGDP